MSPVVKPYANGDGKREQVERMFDRISPRYDLLNRLFSMGIDQRWRRLVVRALSKGPVHHVLDVATGTADLAILAAAHAKHVTGIDVSEGMLARGAIKVKEERLQDRIDLQRAAAEALPFADASFDAVTVAFGARNFDDLEQGIREMRRVLRPDGRLFILEFSRPTATPFRQLFRFYFHSVMPLVGRIISRDDSAYTYLPKSVDAFPEGRDLLRVLEQNGLREATARPLTGGVATLYQARR